MLRSSGDRCPVMIPRPHSPNLQYHYNAHRGPPKIRHKKYRWLTTRQEQDKYDVGEETMTPRPARPETPTAEALYVELCVEQLAALYTLQRCKDERGV